MTTSQAAFVRGLVRVSIIQLLRSIGFNKSLTYLIDILTDLYIRYFEMLLQQTQRLLLLRLDDEDSNGILIQDISLLIDELALVRPSNQLDLYDIDPVNDNYTQLLEHWTFGDIPDRARDVAKPNLKYIRNKRVDELKTRLTRIGLGGLINSNTSYAFSSKTREEIELEKLLNDEIIINVPEDWVQYLLSKSESSTKQKIRQATFLLDELFDEYSNFHRDEDEYEDNEILTNDKDIEKEALEPELARERENNQDLENGITKKRQPDYIVFGPTPDRLQEFLPYNDKHEVPDFDIARYLNEQNKLMLYNITPEVKLPDDGDNEHFHTDADDTGLQLGGW